MNRAFLRNEAKKVYKEKTKDIPKKNRKSFAEFYKEYKKSKVSTNINPVEPSKNNEEDFNFDDMVNVNMIDNESLEDTTEDNLETNDEKENT